MSVVQNNNRKGNNVFAYHKDTYAILPADRKDETYTENVSGDSDVQAVHESFEQFDTNEFRVQFQRLPVNDERAPNHSDVDTLGLVFFFKFFCTLCCIAHLRNKKKQKRG